jgi:hypothetical protein
VNSRSTWMGRGLRSYAHDESCRSSGVLTVSVTSGVGTEAVAVGGAPDRSFGSPEHTEHPPNPFAPLLAVGLISVLYLVFLLHFAVAAPTADEWAHNIPLVDQATHGHLSFNLFWAQYFQSRMLFPNLLFVLVGVPSHYDPRWFVAISAVCYIASLFIILAVVRRYLGTGLRTLPTVIVALVWFSLSAVSDALWAFELGYYLVILSLALVIYCLLVPRTRRWPWLALAVIAAVVGSYSFTQGLLVWPVGLVILLFSVRPTRRVIAEVAVWLGCAAVTTGLFFWHFDFAATNSLCTVHCGVGYTLSHPGLTLSYWMRMVGNVVPSVRGTTGTVQIILGVILTAAAVLVVVQSFRERRRNPMVALPLAIVVFALLWDMIITAGRVALHSPGFHEYTLAQMILLVGIMIFAWDHAGGLPVVAKPTSRGAWTFARLACIGLSFLVLIQILASAKYGWDESESVSADTQLTAQLGVNLAAIPSDLQSCYLDAIFDADLVPTSDLGPTRALLDLAERDKLGMFGPAVIKQFRAEGPPKLPKLFRRCTNEATGGG